MPTNTHDCIDLFKIGRSCGNQILHLDLSYCDQVTDSGLKIVVQRFKELRTLKFQHFQGKGDPITLYCENSRRIQAAKLNEISFPACRYVSYYYFLFFFRIFSWGYSNIKYSKKSMMLVRALVESNQSYMT